MITYGVEKLDTVESKVPLRWQNMALMSPFIIRKDDRYRALIRAVPPKDSGNTSTGYIISGWSDDGIHFDIDDDAAIGPGINPDDLDAGGVEDPTIQLTSEDKYLVYYTGVEASHQQGSLNVARGSNLTELEKCGKAMKAPPGEGNIKEATLWQTPKGDWRLFYEYAQDSASRIGMASGPTSDGPWTPQVDPFTIRHDSWDDWHLSTGPICVIDGQDPVMFYNGATKDARWRIGWISFDPDFTRVTGRGVEPVILPPPPSERDATDIAFAASTLVEGDTILLYFSIEDRLLRRASIKLFSSD